MAITINNSGVTFNDGSNQPTSSPKVYALWNSSGGIRISYNVSSVGKPMSGGFTINFSSALGSALYAVAGSTNYNSSGGEYGTFVDNATQWSGNTPILATNTSSVCYIATGNTSLGATNSSYNSVIIER